MVELYYQTLTLGICRLVLLFDSTSQHVDVALYRCCCPDLHSGLES